MRLLMDEHIPDAIRTQLLQHLPDVEIWRVGSVGTPPFGTPDPQLLEWCELHGFILVTNNRRSMPRHLAEHLALGRHVPGILTIDLSEGIGVLVRELKDVAELSFEGEYQDRIEYIPLQR